MAEEYLPDVTPGSPNNHDFGANYTLGEKTINAGAGADLGIRVWIPAGVTTAPTLLLYDDANTTPLKSMTATGYTPGSFHSQYFDAPVTRPDATVRVAAFWTPDGRYGASVPGGWPHTSAGGNLTAGTSNGWIHDGGGSPIYPEVQHGSGARFHISPIFEADAAEPTVVFGTMSGPFAFAAPLVGTRRVSGTTTAAFAFTAPATGTRRVPGSLAAAFAFTAPAVGTVRVAGSLSAPVVFSAPMTGTRRVVGALSAVVVFAAPMVGPVTLAAGWPPVRTGTAAAPLTTATTPVREVA